jgi:hypothetical protein
MSLALPTVPQTSWRRTEPDLDLIKQVEQVTTFVLAGACQDSEHRDQGAVEVLAFSIDHYLISLMFGCKEQQKQLGAAGGNPFAKRQSGKCRRPHPVVPRTGPNGLPSYCSAKFGETGP